MGSFENGVTGEILIITPEMAAEWIKCTKGYRQRQPNTPLVRELSKCMTDGIWTMQYQPIQLGVNKNVLDGQHRLLACIKSGVSFKSLVLFNVPEDGFDYIDRGRSRTLGDILSSRNVKNACYVASTIQILYAIHLDKTYLHGGIKADGRNGGQRSSGNNRVYRISPTKMDSFLKDEPDFESFISDSLAIKKRGGNIMNASVFCAAWFCASKIDFEKANDFFGQIALGVGLDPGNPALYIRKRLIYAKTEYKPMSSADLLRLCFRGFEIYVKGTPASTFAFFKTPAKLEGVILFRN